MKQTLDYPVDMVEQSLSQSQPKTNLTLFSANDMENIVIL